MWHAIEWSAEIVRVRVTNEVRGALGIKTREALNLIDRGLGDISERSLVSTSEVADLLLDVRSVLSKLDAEVSTN